MCPIYCISTKFYLFMFFFFKKRKICNKDIFNHYFLFCVILLRFVWESHLVLYQFQMKPIKRILDVQEPQEHWQFKLNVHAMQHKNYSCLYLSMMKHKTLSRKKNGNGNENGMPAHVPSIW